MLKDLSNSPTRQSVGDPSVAPGLDLEIPRGPPSRDAVRVRLAAGAGGDDGYVESTVVRAGSAGATFNHPQRIALDLPMAESCQCQLVYSM